MTLKKREHSMETVDVVRKIDDLLFSEISTSMIVPRNRAEKNDSRFIHPAKSLDKVMKDILHSENEQAFCFLNEGQLRARMALFKQHFIPEMPERRIYYAMKANPRDRIMQILTEEGLDGFDCASVAEVRRALSFMKSDQIIYNHPIKKKRDIEEARSYGVPYYTAQSETGIQRILDACHSQIFVNSSQVEIALRVATPNDKAAIDLSSKYGCMPSDAGRLINKIRASGAIAALSMNTGSQNGDVGMFSEGIELLTGLANRNGKVSSINLGGGFPVNYFSGDRYDLPEYLNKVSHFVRRNVHRALKANMEGKIIIEPGRSMVADAVDLVIPVLEIDERRGERRVYIDDGVFTSFSDKVVHDWQYNYAVYTADGRPPSAARRPYLVYGRTCDSGDTLGRVELSEDLRVGDFLWVKNAGAYMDCQTTHFNGFEPPQYVSYNT